ncbi:MAG: TetR/AcrR family transcriptional regulator [Acidobacteria bacterium]|nr:TetR/AcrR family transcriptional regulator [Acidobacteriota bacterium]
MVLNVEEHKRRAILEKAREWIGTNGFSEFTMDKLAAFCGVAKGTLYNYFDSKEGLLVKVVEESVRGIHREEEEILSGPGGPEEKLRNMIRRALIFYRENMALLTMYANEVKIADCKFPSAASAHGRFIREHLDWVMTRLEKLLAEMGIQKERRLLSYLFHEFIGNLMTFNMLFGRETDVERDVEILYSFYFKGVEAFQ